MRLDRVYIDGFKNLKQLDVDFDEQQLTTVLIGQNGAGKSNLIEAITEVFRWVDLRRHEPQFRYRVDYRIHPRSGSAEKATHVRLSNIKGESAVSIDGKDVKHSEFEKNKDDWFPDLVFGYYSGSSRRLEALFDTHQAKYYKTIAINDDEAACYKALQARRLFFCRPVHGELAMLCLFAFLESVQTPGAEETPENKFVNALKATLKITGFHSALALFREPWYAKGGKAVKASEAANFWGAAGPAGRTAARLKELAFHPIALTGNAIDDYRDKKQDEAQFAVFLNDLNTLRLLRKQYTDESDMFYALEALDVSDLIRAVEVWVTRDNDATGDVSFSGLSDGERQLLMVLGMIRVSRGQRALYLLDEPDTHLNPHWQYSYLQWIKDWMGIAADEKKCHIILTSHNPLTISALTRDEIRVLTQLDDGRVSASAPYADPKGMGFTATLTEIFGLRTSLDVETQRLVDDRNKLAKLPKKSDLEEQKFIEINDKLSRLGFLFEDREPLYQDFLLNWHDVRYADKPPLTPEQIASRQRGMKALIERLMTKEADT